MQLSDKQVRQPRLGSDSNMEIDWRYRR